MASSLPDDLGYSRLLDTLIRRVLHAYPPLEVRDLDNAVNSFVRLCRDLFPLREFLVYHTEDGMPIPNPIICSSKMLGQRLAGRTLDDFGIPSSRDPATQSLRYEAEPKIPPKSAVVYMTRKVVLWRLICTFFTKLISGSLGNARLLEWDYLVQANFDKFVPGFQWVIKTHRPMMAILDVDNLQSGNDLNLILTTIDDLLQPAIKPIVCKRWQGEDILKAHIYLTGTFFSCAEIKLLCAKISQETSIDIDASIYDASHTIRVFGSLKNGRTFDDRSRPSDLFDLSELQTYSRKYSHEFFTNALLQFRSQCEQCATHFRSGGKWAENPFADQKRPDRLVFCVKCAIKMQEYLFTKCWPYCKPTVTSVRNEEAFTELHRAYKPLPQMPVETTAESILETRDLPTPFDCNLCTREEALRNSYSTLPSHMLKMVQAFPTFFHTVGDAIDSVIRLQDEICLRVLRCAVTSVGAEELIYYLDVLGTDDAVFLDSAPDKWGKFLNKAAANFTIMDQGERFVSAVNELSGPLIGVWAAKCVKGTKFSLSMVLKDIARNAVAYHRIPNPEWKPYNHLITPPQRPNRNSYMPPFFHRVPAVGHAPYCADFEKKLDTLFTFFFKHLFDGPARGPTWGFEDNFALFVFWWRFVGMRLRFPGGHSFEGASFQVPEIAFIFYGPQGRGKTSMVLGLLTALFTHVKLVISTGTTFDKADNFINSIFSVFDEVSGVDINEVKQTTNREVSVRALYRAARKILNFVTQVYLTNNLTDVFKKGSHHVCFNDRRFIVIGGGAVLTEKHVIPELLRDERFICALFYSLTLGFTGDFSHTSSVTRRLIPFLNADAQASVGSPDSQVELVREWAGVRAPFSPYKQEMLNMWMSAQHKFLITWLNRGVNLSAAIKNLPTWLVKDPTYWDRDGYWCRVLPLYLIPPIYSAFVNSGASTTEVDWAAAIRSLYFPDDTESSQTWSLDEFLNSELGENDYGMLYLDEGDALVLPSYLNCAANFKENSQWSTWSPSVYLSSGADHYSHYMVMETKPQPRIDEWGRVTKQTAIATGLDLSHRVEASMPQYQLSRLVAPLFTMFNRTSNQRTNFAKLLYAEVMEESRALRDGTGPFADITRNHDHVERSRENMRKRPVMTASQSIDDPSQGAAYDTEEDLVDDSTPPHELAERTKKARTRSFDVIDEIPTQRLERTRRLTNINLNRNQ